MEVLFGLFGVLFVAAFIIGWSLVSAFINSFVLTKLWFWFMVPIFGLHPLPMSHAYAVFLVVGLFTQSLSRSAHNKEGKEAVLTVVGSTILNPLMILLAGWIVKTYFF